MNVYATSDLHLGHVNILKYTDSRKKYISNPEAGVTADDVARMTTDVINRYNARVQDGDVVYILGDLAMGQKDRHAWFFSQLRGYKILVMGNHDELRVRDPSTGQKRAETLDEARTRFKSLGFAEVYDQLIVTHPDYGLIYMRHIPTMKFTGNYMFCGHVHESFDRIENVINVGVDVRDLEPKTFKELIEAPAKGLLGNHRLEDVDGLQDMFKVSN